MDEEKWLAQNDVHQEFIQLGFGQWTTVYKNWHDSKRHDGGIYCALSSPDYRKKALQDPGWDLTVTDGSPGFSQHHEGSGEWVTTYYRHGGGREAEPLVIVREFYGAKPSYKEISEEFRLFHNLWWDATRNCYTKPNMDGGEEIAIEMSEDEIRIRTKLLRQYQAARQIDLLLFIDSVRHALSKESVLPDAASWNDDAICAERYSSNVMPPVGITRYLATRVIPPLPIEKSGIWPFEEQDNYFPDFIIGTNEDGDVRYTCNPDALGNYFGGNPDAPHYLTPVHFRKEVLQKYYEKPEVYRVEDGYLRCAALWGLRMDNDHPDRVVVFLGDLGRDLPKTERDYWHSFNAEPDGGMSKTAFQRAFMSEFADPEAPDLKFRQSYTKIMELWPAQEGWHLFQEPKGHDKQLLQRFRVPLNESQTEFENSIEILAKLISDGLNDKGIQAQLSEKIDNEKSISKLKRWLAQEGYPHVDRDIKLLRNVQELRSKVSAHRKGVSYEKALSDILGDARGKKAAVIMINRANHMLSDLYDWRTKLN